MNNIRPINLTISAFGPYSDKVQINLEKLGDSGIYLITGDTGAGKTTIFDAITYALYGEASSSTRQTSFFRSKYADENTKTFVEMEFLHRDERYFVKRNPEYQRPKKRGDGYTKQDANAVLYYPDGRQVLGVKEVTFSVINLLGLNQEQFKKIIMLPQNDFAKMLLSSTKERIEIFRHIFDTQKCSKIQNILFERNKEIDNKNNAIILQITQYIKEIKYNNDEELLNQLEQISQNVSIQTIKKVFDILCRLDANAKDKLKHLTDKMQEYKKSIDFKEKLLDKVKQNMIIKNDIEKLKKNLICEKENFESVEKEFMLIDDYNTRIDKLKEQIILDENSLKKFNEIDNLISQKEILLKEKQQLIESKDYSERILNKNKDIVKIKNNVIEQLKDLDFMQLDVNKEIDALSIETQRFIELNTRWKSYSLHKEKLKEKQVQYVSLKEIYDKLYCDYMCKESLFFNSQAGILAESLKDGQSCPVCGSISHPKKAKKCDNAPTAKELEIQKDKLEYAKQNLKNCLDEYKTIEIKLEFEQKELSSNLGKIFNTSDFEIEKLSDYILKYNQIINQKNEHLKKQQRNLNEGKVKRDTAIKDKKELEDSITLLEKNVREIDKKIAVHITQINIKNELIEKLNLELPVNKRDLLKNKINDSRQQINYIISKIDDITSRHSRYEKNIQTLKVRIHTLNNQIEKLENDNIDIEQLSKEIKEEENILNNISDEISNIKANKQNNKEKLTKINVLYKELNEVEQEYRIINPLYKTANGTITGKSKINFETYAQTSYFDKIIKRANNRFKVMTNGQYELERRKENISLKDGGLELNVIDYYNNSKRDSKTLSGGELFKASLSLALGLSDEIQASCGGVKIDSLFIDEGFGSLDEDSLKQAIKTLDTLSGKNKLIGIISHVSELKERIDKKIIVTKNRINGSNIVIES